MGAGGTSGVKTNGDRVVEIIEQGQRTGNDLYYQAQMICDALGVDPESEFVA